MNLWQINLGDLQDLCDNKKVPPKQGGFRRVLLLSTSEGEDDDLARKTQAEGDEGT